jgi:hypothetical protein
MLLRSPYGGVRNEYRWFVLSAFLWLLTNMTKYSFTFAVALPIWLATLLRATGRWPLILSTLAVSTLGRPFAHCESALLVVLLACCVGLR